MNGSSHDLSPDEAASGAESERGEHPVSRMIFAPMRTQAFANRCLVATAVLAGLLVGVGLLAGGVSAGRIESLPGFYGLFGFGAFSLAVLSGWPLGRFLRRGERYYDRAESRDVD
ncbi:MAG: hypothetical protein KGS00_05900 [Alphaproteobacteria bacterium]|nr:hypothetical protein [Alphaproteobacteria bacterium]